MAFVWSMVTLVWTETRPPSILWVMEEEPDLLDRVDALARESATLSNLDEPSAASDLLAAKEEIAQLRVALEHRTVIGEAIGIIMERFGLNAEAAWEVLSRLSQERNRKVYAIAQELIGAGHSEGL
jgi:AmiR/NasT family two-component response regulator